jgi:hypothetical protein
MSTTARFRVSRRAVLEEIFQVSTLAKTWRNVVKNQLRNQEIKDLFDYYDFNFYVEKRAKEIRFEVINGEFKPQNPLIFQIEKKHGICRHVMIPSPTDALVIQTITEYLAPAILESKPSARAFYSRDKHAVKLPHEVEAGVYSDWSHLWKKFQKEIYKFNDSFDFLVVTDVSNFFDSISLRELRQVFTSRVKTQEVLVDLIFSIVENLCWHPDYLPTSNRGLPTVNTEAFRLLAHVLLFEVDDILETQTSGSFVRWMDDINFGANSKKEASLILKDISEVLKSRGLALNLSKTSIFSSEEGEYHYCIKMNKYLDTIPNPLRRDPEYKKVVKDLNAAFKKHLKDRRPKAWEKVTKRFFTKFKNLRFEKVLHHIPELYSNHPALRPNLLFYLSGIGFNLRTEVIVCELIRDLDEYDDISRFQLSNLITNWSVPIGSEGGKFLSKVFQDFRKKKLETKFDFFCQIWLSSKYASPHVLYETIDKLKNFWIRDPFLCRQVMAATPRLLSYKPVEVTKLLKEQVAYGPRESASVANAILEFSNLKIIPPQLSLYLFPTKYYGAYPLPKFLILLSILNSINIPKDDALKKKIFEFMSDPYYRFWIEKEFGIDPALEEEGMNIRVNYFRETATV